MTITAEQAAKLLEGTTPGPWVVFIDDSGGQWTGWPLSIEAVSITDKTVVRPGGQWPYKWDAHTSQNETVANAHLIVVKHADEPMEAALVARAALADRIEKERPE